MNNIRDWQRNRDLWVRVLELQTGAGVRTWNRLISSARARDERSLRAWLTERGVTGYAQSLLVMERFGYPDLVVATADQLVDDQYADRPSLRPIHDAIVYAATTIGKLTIQARKTYVSLVSPRRTFARIQPTTRKRVDLGVRLQGLEPSGRLRASRIHPTMALQIELTSPHEVDAEVREWLQKAYDENC